MEISNTVAARGRMPVATDEQVIAAGEQLEAAGKRVTGYLIRAALGGVGRTDRYNELWAKHVAARAAGATPEAPPAPVATLPAEIRAALDDTQASIGSALEALALSVQRHVNEVNAARVADADRRTAEAVAALADAEAAGEKAMDDAQTEIERLTAELEAANQRAADADHARQLAEDVASERGKQLQATEARERDALAKAAGLQEHVENLRRAGEAQAKELASTKEAVSRLEREKGVAETLANERGNALKTATQRVQSLEAAAADHQRRADEAQRRADAAQARADDAGQREHAEIERSRALDARIKDLETQLAKAGEKKGD